MKPNLPKSYEDLINGYYGKESNLLKEPNNVEDLFAQYYGSRKVLTNGKLKTKAAQVLSLRCDDGEVLTQRRPRRSAIRRALARQSSQSIGLGIPEQTAVNPSNEINTDLADNQPNQESDTRRLASQDNSIQNETPRQQNQETQNRQPIDSTYQHNEEQRSSDIYPGQPKTKPASPQEVTKKDASLDKESGKDEDEFEADIKAILSGKKVYDPASGKTVDREKTADNQTKEPPPPPSNNGDGQAIFDRIAQSMEYANAFDLGTVELQNRFADFDRMDDQRRQNKSSVKKNKDVLTSASRSADSKHSTEEFIKDLDNIRTAKTEDGSSAHEAGESLSLPASYVSALYGTGEHVMVAETLFPDKFLIGKPPGVRFSYGQIIALADMFDNYSQLLGTGTGELQEIKRLVDQSTRYYKSGKPKNGDVTSEQWDTATAQRYLRLAEDNYDHFAPNFLFPNIARSKSTGHYGDHKAAWEAHHKIALDMVREDSHSSDPGYFPHDALIVNAYGDHFLTDAFAAGHIINKQAIMKMFKDNFYSGNSLTKDAKQFFHMLGVKAFSKDKVRTKFSKLETYDAYGFWFIKWHPNMDSVGNFVELLKGIAEQEPDAVANLVVKALHDKLNKVGIEVQNQVKPASWHLTGDGHLTQETLAIMRQAVEQSIANVRDTGILVSGFDIQPYYEKVWRHVPRLTAASEKIVKDLAKNYTSPKSTELVDAAANLIEDEVDILIRKLKDKHKLRDN